MSGKRIKKTVFLVEDDADIGKLVTYNLEESGFITQHFLNAEAMLAFLHRKIPDIFIIDILLPGIDGWELIKELRYRPETRALPIIVLTCKSEETDKVLGLELGADDYITKPFSMKELLARIKAILRREAKSKPAVLKSGELLLDPESFIAKQKGKELDLTTTEFKILNCFLENAGTVIHRNKIIALVYGYDKPIIDRTVDVHICNLRRKLGEDGKKIKSVRGVGYKFSPES